MITHPCLSTNPTPSTTRPGPGRPASALRAHNSDALSIPMAAWSPQPMAKPDITSRHHNDDTARAAVASQRTDVLPTSAGHRLSHINNKSYGKKSSHGGGGNGGHVRRDESEHRIHQISPQYPRSTSHRSNCLRPHARDGHARSVTTDSSSAVTSGKPFRGRSQDRHYSCDRGKVARSLGVYFR